MEESFDRELKVLVIGNGQVGKTSMIKRFAKGVFTDEYKKTIGVDFLEKALFVDALAEEVRFMLWDTAGQEEFDALTRTYYRGAGAAVLAFSTTDRASFDAIPTWKKKVEAECGEIAMALVQNKVDLIDQAVVTPQEVEALARTLKLKLYRTCVKDNLNVTDVFVYLSELHQRKEETRQEEQQEEQQQQQAPRPAQTFAKAPSPKGAETSEEKRGEVDEGAARTVDLKPSKQRTKGKKSSMGCSLA